MAQGPRLNGIIETALYVDDLERAARFYERLFGLTRMYADERLVGFDVGGRSVLLLFRRGASVHGTDMPGGFIPGHDGSGPLHAAFAVAAEDLPAWEAKLAAEGVAIESRRIWGRGATSVYVRDPDGHMLELATPGLWADVLKDPSHKRTMSMREGVL